MAIVVHYVGIQAAFDGRVQFKNLPSIIGPTPPQRPRVDPSADGNEAIRRAAEIGRTEVVRLLLKDPRVDPSAKDNYAIRWAAAKGHAAVVELLLKDPRVDPSAENNKAIRMAAQNGHADVVAPLLKDPRVDPSADNNYACYRYVEVVELLKADYRFRQ